MTDHVTVAFIGGGFAGLVTGARLKEAGHRRRPHHREGRRLRRHVVLEPLSRARSATPRRSSTCRCSKRPGTCRPRSTRTRPRSSSTAGASASSSASTTTRCSTPRSPTSSGTTTRSRWIVRTNRGDEFTAQFVGDGHRPAARAEAARASPASSRSRGTRSTPAGGTTSYTGGDPLGRADGQAGRQARRDHRHRRDRGAVRAAPGARRARSCTSSSARRRRSTCATTGRPIPSGSPRSRRRVGSSAGSRTSPPTRPAAMADEDLVHGRLDRPRPPHPRTGSWRCRPRTSRPRR